MKSILLRAPLAFFTAILTISAMLAGRARTPRKWRASTTNFHLTGSDRVVVEAYDDPAVTGVTCYVSRARRAASRARSASPKIRPKRR